MRVPVRAASSYAKELARLGGGRRGGVASAKAAAAAAAAAESEALAERDQFRPLYIFPPKSGVDTARRDVIRKEARAELSRSRHVAVDRETLLEPGEQDWPDLWPAAASFRAAAVPLPLRMGWKTKNQKYEKPRKHANLELMKIPNFLHLTPLAIERHCNALKKFCTAWPAGLSDEGDYEKHLPVEIVTNDWTHSGPTIRDSRARQVTLRVRLRCLPLDSHARDKLQRLVGRRWYDASTDMLTIVADRCPTRQQNHDYVVYLLTALVHESRKTEKWETELKSEVDEALRSWRVNPSYQHVTDSIRRLVKRRDDLNAKKPSTDVPEAMERQRQLDAIPSFVRDLPAQPSQEDIDENAAVDEFRRVWHDYRNQKETAESVDKYGQAARKLLGLS